MALLLGRESLQNQGVNLSTRIPKKLINKWKLQKHPIKEGN